MIKILPILLMALAAFAFARFSGWRTAKSLERRSRVLDDGAIRSITQRLTRASGIDGLTVHALDTPIVNALASPDGRIYLSEGMLAQFRRGHFSDAELASVIGHELGHVTLGHSRRRMIDVSAAHVGRVVLMGVLGRLIPFVGVFLANALSQLFVARLSQQDEFEADAYATALMVKSGYGAGPQKALLRKIAQLSPTGGTGPVSWLASHPPIDDRIRAIESNAADWTR